MAKHLAPAGTPQKPPIWRTKVAVSAVLMLAVVVLTVAGFRWLMGTQDSTPPSTIAVNSNQPPPAPPDTTEVSEAPGATDMVIVHVAGEVHEPGIVELPPEARVVDAIAGAGGATEEAAVNALNLAALVHDGEYILVPSQQDAQQGLPGGPPAGPGTSNTTGQQSVNLNTADSAALETLPGIGPATAAQIIAHREQHGPFQELADIEAVSGIGPATRERLDGLVSW